MAPTTVQLQAQTFRIIRTIAESALAQYVLVEAATNGQRLVWKILRPECASDPDALGRFMDEALISRLLEHPYVVRSFGAGRLPDGRLYQAMEFLEGMELGAWIHERGPLTPEDALRIFIPVCDAVGYLHASGIVHRDLRPRNIFLCGSLGAYQPKLMGFRLARFGGPKTVETVAGTLLSRPEYSAPECIRGLRGDERSDVYALGISLYEALTGSPPFPERDARAVLDGHLSHSPPPLPAASAHLYPLIKRCLAKEPKDRFATARELLQELSEFGVLPVVSETLPTTALVPDMPAEKPGDVVGPYELMEQLGDGGMARVYLARHVTVGRRFALKILKPEQAQQQDLVARFVQEARAVNQIRHPNTVEIYDLVDETLPSGLRRTYCVMEPLEGVNLREAIAQGPLPISRAVGIIRQVCLALGAAHSVGVVHRDIKPENIFLVRDSERVKVLDFGVAKLKPELGHMPKTLAGLIIGTPGYMAPEQAQGEDVDHRADIYAVGTVLYELLAGDQPFHATAFIELVMRIATELPPPLPTHTPGGEPIASGLEAIILRCLEKKPAARFQSIAALGKALERYEQQPRPAPDASPTPDVEAFRAIRSRRWPALAVMGALGLVLAVGALAFSSHRAAEARTYAAVPHEPPAAVEPSGPLPAHPPAPETLLARLPAADPGMVALRVTSVPPGARVSLASSGVDLGMTPLVREVKRGTAPTPLVIRLDGYRAEARAPAFASDVDLMINLDPLSPTPPPTPTPPAAAAHRPKAARPAPVPRASPPAHVDPDDLMDPYAR